MLYDEPLWLTLSLKLAEAPHPSLPHFFTLATGRTVLLIFKRLNFSPFDLFNLEGEELPLL